MKYLLYPIRFIILTLIVLPIWVLICIAELFTSIISNLILNNNAKKEKKYRNIIKDILIDFKTDLGTIFLFY